MRKERREEGEDREYRRIGLNYLVDVMSILSSHFNIV